MHFRPWKRREFITLVGDASAARGARQIAAPEVRHGCGGLPLDIISDLTQTLHQVLHFLRPRFWQSSSPARKGVFFV
jgi:hypothetical protein